MNSLLVLALIGIATLAAAFPSFPAVEASPIGVDYAHRAVVVNAQMEAQLPDQLKNPFYRNPRIAQALAKESWFGPGESPVAVREAEKIPRKGYFQC